ncbi:hypothetical protein MTYP_02361 [Methylophilaceae bacterium]|nr:hypothetical protein MTYP_02361 [Methylophilaceae bacterium]
MLSVFITMHPFPSSRKFLLIPLACLLAACAAGPRTVSISEAELQKRITEQLSVPITVLKIFDINLTNPVVRLDAGTERLHAQLDTSVSNPVSGEQLLGKLNISGKLRFDPALNAIMLSESKIENLNMQGVDARYNEAFSLLASKMGEELLNHLPLYTLKPEELTRGSTRYAPSAFNIRGNDLQVTLVPQ